MAEQDVLDAIAALHTHVDAIVATLTDIHDTDLPAVAADAAAAHAVIDDLHDNGVTMRSVYE